MMEAKPKDFDLQTVIGCGCDNCATVSIAWHRPTEQHVAVKRINLEQSEMDFNTIQHEVFQYKLFNHPNIMPCYCSFVYNKELWIVMPLMGFGSCRDLLHAHFTEGLPEAAIAYIIRDVLNALDYIHNRGIIHRSVKASHILISSSGNVMLSGFRHSYSMMQTGRRARVIYDFPSHYVNSLFWASPELLEQNLAGYDTKSDIYSLGITACELANGIVPFSDMNATQMLLQKVQGVTPKLLDVTTIGEPGDLPVDAAPFHRNFSAHFHNFVELCLQSDPGLRDIDQEDLVNNTLFKIHASSFMQAVDVVCSALPTIEKDCPVSRRLIILGAQHATVPGFDLVYFSIFAKCLHMTWEKVLKEEYTAEVKEAWTNLFDFVMDRISDGYVLYNQEEQTAEKTKLEKELEGQVGNGYDVSVRN